jgi:hypothetical protein
MNCLIETSSLKQVSVHKNQQNIPSLSSACLSHHDNNHMNQLAAVCTASQRASLRQLIDKHITREPS